MYAFEENVKIQSIKSSEETKCCCECFCWLFQLAVWTSFTFIFYCLYDYKCNEVVMVPISCFGPFYFLYIIFEFCSKEFKYLCNKSSKGVYEIMGDLFKAPPSLILGIECYDEWETVEEHVKEDGTIEKSRSYDRTTKYVNDHIIPYYSSRDVSGLFHINSDINAIRLELTEEINFADSISYYNYLQEKEYIYEKHKHKANNCSLSNKFHIPGLEQYNLVPVNSESDSCCLNVCIFILFILIGFGEIYKIYFKCTTVYKHFIVRKLVSLRYDLNNNIYNPFRPRIKFLNKIQEYTPDYYNIKYGRYKTQIPTNQEIQKAKQYEKKIPQYIISNGINGTQENIVIPYFEESPIRNKYIYANNNNIIRLPHIENIKQNDDYNNNINNISPNNIQVKIYNDINKMSKAPQINVEREENMENIVIMNDRIKHNNTNNNNEEAPPIVNELDDENPQFNVINFRDNYTDSNRKFN